MGTVIREALTQRHVFLSGGAGVRPGKAVSVALRDGSSPPTLPLSLVALACRAVGQLLPGSSSLQVCQIPTPPVRCVS